LAELRRVVAVESDSHAEYVTAQPGKSWAVVTEIDEYRDPRIPRLKYSVTEL
jgi:hypothetical protein